MEETGRRAQRSWWVPGALLGLLLAVLTLITGGEMASAVAWGIGGLAGGLATGAVRYLASVRSRGLPGEDDPKK